MLILLIFNKYKYDFNTVEQPKIILPRHNVTFFNETENKFKKTKTYQRITDKMLRISAHIVTKKIYLKKKLVRSLKKLKKIKRKTNGAKMNESKLRQN